VNSTRWTKWITLISLLSVIAGCVGPGASSSEPSLKDKAAAEATAIIQRAEATAIVLQAQATASAMLDRAKGEPPTAEPIVVTATPEPVPVSAATPSPATNSAFALPTASAPAATQAVTPSVELLGVGFAADTGFIMVEFKADPRVARRWMQGTVYVVDESSGAIYNEIPVMPTVGPLLGRPKEPGQVGYVMLVNAPPGIHSGSIVTVVLGDFKQEHVTVSGDG
jgi:hypothetical protein